MSQTPSPLGKTGEVEIIKVFTAKTWADTNEGRGPQYDRTFHETEKGAKFGTIGIGIMGGDGTLGERFAVRFEDGTLMLLDEGQPIITLENEELLESNIRKKALSKLSVAERQALGLT